MPRIKSELFARTDRFTTISRETELHNEHNDCAVKAVALACDVTYDDAHAVMKELGREDRSATPFNIIEDAVKHFGFKMQAVNPDNYIKDYPGVHGRVLKNVTTHHPDRFNQVWADEQTYLFFGTKHVGVVINGMNHDWTRGSAKRVGAIYAVIPKTAKVSKYLKERAA